MVAGLRGRRLRWAVWALTAAGAVGVAPALAQQAGRGTKAAATKPAAAKAKEEMPTAVERRVPVNPNDPVATVNGEVITRGQLADECIARKGEEVLEMLIARKLIDQAIRSKNMQVTPKEVDDEIERVAQTLAGKDRETWLRILAKEKNISPTQYARDIIYPSIALRKLAEPGVVVSDKDMKEAFEAQFGERLRCRIIMTATLDHAKAIWEEVKKNPNAFERVAASDPRSIDQATRAVGGMLTEPLCRHAHPRTVSDAAFKQLVDLDPQIDRSDKEAVKKYTPKNGEISGPIQVNEASWVIIKREDVIPAQPYDPNNPALVKQMRELVHEAKLKDQMSTVYDDMLVKAKIDNKLSGKTNTMTGAEAQPEPKVTEARLMSDPDNAIPVQKDASVDGNIGRARLAPPPGVSAEDRKGAEKLKK